MSTDCRKGCPRDLLDATKFGFTIDKLNCTISLLHGVELPGVTIGDTLHPTSVLDYGIPGEKIVYDDLTLTFLLDENMDAYVEIYKWMLAIANPTRTELRETGIDNWYSDGSLITRTNKENPNRVIRFFDMWPSNISSISFDTQNTDEPVRVTATFRYSYFLFE
ncbi:MAG: hypothetical protein BV459_00305 [Thermoplasmata archaeon M11B2D]|nr:MAG: hypothetical protein BV459_00305 [Thermoplasmata archaeon M11B2D]